MGSSIENSGKDIEAELIDDPGNIEPTEIREEERREPSPNMYDAEGRGESLAIEKQKTRRTIVKAGAIGLVVVGLLYSCERFGDTVDNVLGGKVEAKAISPESAMTYVELTDRTIIAEADVKSSSTVDTRYCPPIIGCNIPGSSQHAAAEATGVLQVVAEKNAIALSTKVDGDGGTHALATIKDAKKMLTTQMSGVNTKHQGDSGFLLDVASAFGADDGRNGLFNMVDQIAVESGERACSKALNPIVAEAVGGTVIDRIKSTADLLESQGDTAVADTLRTIASQPVYVDLGIPEKDFKLAVNVRYEPGRYQSGPATLEIAAEQDCMLTPLVNQQLIAIEKSGSVIVVEPQGTPTPTGTK